MKPIEIPFEKLKARAQRALSQRLGERITQGIRHYDSFASGFNQVDVLALITLDEGFRQRVAERCTNKRPIYLADAVVAEIHDIAKGCIDYWDVRQVRGLIRAFPDIVPKGYVDAPIQCYIEDSEESPWIVAIGGQA